MQTRAGEAVSETIPETINVARGGDVELEHVDRERQPRQIRQRPSWFRLDTAASKARDVPRAAPCDLARLATGRVPSWSPPVDTASFPSKAGPIARGARHAQHRSRDATYASSVAVPWRSVSRWALTVGMVGAGINHFLAPATYEAMMPDALPAHAALVAISGVAEILGGLGLILPATRRLAAYGLIALLIAVFPANINMALNDLPLGASRVPAWALWARLPLQLVLIWWTYRVSRDPA
jgi:uncharacterized membrane protein